MAADHETVILIGCIFRYLHSCVLSLYRIINGIVKNCNYRIIVFILRMSQCPYFVNRDMIIYAVWLDRTYMVYYISESDSMLLVF